MKRTVVSYICGLALFGAPFVQAQFHQKDKKGQSQLNHGAVNMARQPQNPGGPAPEGKQGKIPTGFLSKDLGLNDNSTMISSDAQRAKFPNNNVHLSKQKGDVHIDHWSRSIQHSDGSYTETNAKLGMTQITQQTKSKNGILLLKRNITLDSRGQPTEILMFDGRDKFKYRGILIYDKLGRFEEEQLFDANKTPLRRKIQKYDAQGLRLPLQTFDYVENIPKDLRLVITEENEKGRGEQAQALVASIAEKEKQKKAGIFGNKKTNKSETGGQRPAQTTQVQASSPPGPAPKKMTLLERLRLKKKNNKK